MREVIGALKTATQAEPGKACRVGRFLPISPKRMPQIR
jgi:hypothetical protein